MQSRFLKEGELVEMRCQIQETTAQGYDLLELKRRQYNENGGLVTLTNRSSNSLYYSFILTPEDAGIYFCYFRGQASIMTLKVASKVEIKNGTARTINSDKDPFSKMVYQDSLVTEADLNDAFMVCEARFDESIHLGMITPTWSSPTLKNVEHTDRYNFVSWRNESFRTVGSRLTLRHPSDKLETYGKYTCIFAFEDIGQVEWDVYLKIAPILTLPLSPPPPPLLETGLTNPNCSQNQALANLTAQWRQACRIVVAYPPVPAYHHVWNWSNGEAALYAIRSAISPHLTEEKVEALEQVIQQAAAEQYSGGCSGLLVRQNASTFPSHHTPTLFWCYAENEVGKTVVRWPQQYQKSRLPNWAIWLMVFQAVGATISALILVWCFCCRHPYHRRLLLDRASRWTSYHFYIQSPRQEHCRLVMVGPADASGELINGSATLQIS